MTTYTEAKRIGDIIKREYSERLYTREAGTMKSGTAAQTVGAVLGKILTAGATETHAGNTGNGAMTLDGTTPVLAGAAPGVYTVKCHQAVTNGGIFNVVAPSGACLGVIAVGQTFANRIKFSIADGATDFVVGDTFLVTVAEGSGKLTALTPAANDGSQIPVGVLATDCDASAADAPCVYLARGPAVVSSDGLVWPAGISDSAKATALATLLAMGIVKRDAY